jgi:chromosome segregation ATPase
VSTQAWTQSDESELPTLSSLLLSETQSLKSEVSSLQQRLRQREIQALDLKRLSESLSERTDQLSSELQQLQMDLQETESLQTALQTELIESRSLRQSLTEQYERQLDELRNERDAEAGRANLYRSIVTYGAPTIVVVATVVVLILF